MTIRVLVVGCGNMGAAHASAYHAMQGMQICGLVSRGDSNALLNEKLKSSYPIFSDFNQALVLTKPDAVCISTYPDTHEEFTLKAFEAGCHVFLEKPIAPNIEASKRVVKAAQVANRKLLVGYILRYHPSWQLFIKEARKLGKPLVMRMNLNQQSHGHMWSTHKSLMQSMSPIVDCGVHYVDVMCQMTQSLPISVSAIGVRLSEEIDKRMYNYGQLHVRFQDGSVGWYEAGWGPMASNKAFFIKDVWGPKGSATITAQQASMEGMSDSIGMHTQTEKIRIHSAELDKDNQFVHPDQWISTEDEPDHIELCRREQQFFLESIQSDTDLTAHWRDAINSLTVVLAADASIRSGKTVDI